MKKTKKPEAEPGRLFDDPPVTETRERTESIEAPEGDTLARILDDLRASQLCGACREGTPIVFGTGPEHARLMIIGEGPGVDDIPSGLPFQGQAGGLLIRMLAAIDVAFAECYVCNVIKCVPPGERNFAVEEIEDCRPFLMRQIIAVNPRLIIAFGALAAQTLLRSKKTISELRGNLFTLHLNERAIGLIPTFNPAYLLRVAEKKREAWEDLKIARAFLAE
jgi:DNA polymerase